MIDTVQAVWLAAIQGLTEFLPISSSAHLILMPRLFDWPDQGIAFDVAVHLGTLLAIVGYLRKDLFAIIGGWFSQWGMAGATSQSKLGWLLIIATIPAIVAGLLISKLAGTTLRDPRVIAVATVAFALLLWWVDHRSKRLRTIDDLTANDAILIGLFQVLALVPGTSRSGITMTAGLMLGLSREAAARFSFLMAVPIIGAAGCLKGVDLLREPELWQPGIFILGVAVAFITAWGVVALFIRFVERVGMLPFVLYRLVLGVALLLLFW